MRSLNDPELDELSEIAVQTAENFIFSKVSKKEILDLNINVEFIYENILDVNILVDLDLDELSSANENIIVEEAIDATLEKIKEFIY
ncbi:MAG: DUF3194 domain-containing protein [Methanobacterium sp.]